ncbi:MAG: EAL domain-containing protein [Sulfurovum sp.]|nr:EAL domain-containing protein [Sulfurovum sp.]
MSAKRTFKYTFTIMGLLILMATYIQYAIDKNTENLQTIEINKAKQYAEKIANYIQNNSCTPISSCLDNSIANKRALDKILHAFQSDNFTNLFVLYRDQKNNFRFLLDSSQDDQAEYKSVFFPESKEFNLIYDTGKPKLIEQSGNVKEVWLSLLHPIMDSNQTKALLVLDLSEKYGNSLKNFNSPLQNIILYLQLFTLFSIIFLAYIIYDSYKLKKSVLVDSLTSARTKLYRKEYFEEHQARKYNFILIDIDKFIQINDRFGRSIADRVLKEFVSYIRSVMPMNATIIRNHGAEFLLMIKKSDVDIARFSHILFDNLSSKKYYIADNIISFSVSMCAVQTPAEVKSFYDIEHIMDKKLLEIKSLGKDRLAILNDISHTDIKYKNIDHIKQAIDDNKLTCLFQPIYHSESKEIYKYEALVRIIDEDDPSRLIPPFYFMDLIRESVHYIRLSKWVIANAFRLLRENPTDRISVNLDLADLYNEEMIHIIQQEIQENKDLANRLTFEILEHQEIKDFDRIDMIFKQLKQFGSSIAIDDFGSGYANFGYIAKLDIDILKIDGSLIKVLDDSDTKMKTIIKLINDMGTSQNIKIVAEHVSSKKIYDILLELNVEFLQGFYLGKPKPWEEYHPST